MKYYLSILLDQKTNYSIRKLVGDVGRVFNDQELDMRWINPELFKLDLIYLGESLNIFQRLLLNFKIRRFSYLPFSITLGIAKIGKKREYKGLVYLTIDKGGDTLREMFYKLSQYITNSYNAFFIPHISLGRINQDLTVEEISNIELGLKLFNNEYQSKTEEIDIKRIYLVGVEENSIKIIKEYPLA